MVQDDGILRQVTEDEGADRSVTGRDGVLPPAGGLVQGEGHVLSFATSTVIT
jgi:hypothetical protein